MAYTVMNWVLKQPHLKPAEFAVMARLADCHNPINGCFPSQEFLVEKCGISRAKLNYTLLELERKGLIVRRREFDRKSKRRKPTRYYFPPEAEKASRAQPNGRKPGKAMSKKTTKPCPISDQSHVHQMDNNLVREQQINQGASIDPATFRYFLADEISEAKEIAATIQAGQKVRSEHVPQRVKLCIKAKGFLTDELIRQAGLAYQES